MAGNMGYLEVIMRWREAGDRLGNPPPSLPAVLGHPAVVFDLSDKYKRAGGDVDDWQAHVEYMQEHFDSKYLERTFPSGEYDQVFKPVHSASEDEYGTEGAATSITRILEQRVSVHDIRLAQIEHALGLGGGNGGKESEE